MASPVAYATNVLSESFASVVQINLITKPTAALAAVVILSISIAPRAKKAEILARIARAA